MEIHHQLIRQVIQIRPLIVQVTTILRTITKSCHLSEMADLVTTLISATIIMAAHEAAAVPVSLQTLCSLELVECGEGKIHTIVDHHGTQKKIENGERQQKRHISRTKFQVRFKIILSNTFSHFFCFQDLKVIFQLPPLLVPQLLLDLLRCFH
jgi:hypothetical protein